jgi:acetyl esterase/lipase
MTSIPKQTPRLGFVTAFVAVTVFTCGYALGDEPKPAKAEEGVLVPTGVGYLPDVTFCTFDDKTTLEMDLAFPSRGAGPFPALVFLHGGGWVLGDRKNMTPYLITAAKSGYVAVAVSYRLAPKHPYPAAIQDAKCAVRFLRANADRYRIDKDRIGAFGFSAGGNLACMLGSTNAKAFEVSGDNPTECDRVQAVASFYGIADVAELHRSCINREVSPANAWLLSASMTRYLQTTCEKDKARYDGASPASRVNKDTPPTILVHGDADTLIPISQSRLYADKLKQSGIDVRLLEVKGADHNFVGDEERQAIKATLEFLDKRLKREVGAVVEAPKSGR